MSDKLTTVLAHTVLAFSSGYSLSNIDVGFSAIGLCLYFTTGVMGAVIHGDRDAGGSSYRVYSNLWVLSIAFALPSISTHLYVIHDFSQSVILLHTLLPVAFCINLYFFSKRTNFSLLETINMPYLLSISYLCIHTINYYGFALVMSYVIALYAIGTTGTIKNMPSRDLLSFSLVFSNYYTVKTINFRN